MSIRERALVVPLHGEQLVAITAEPARTPGHDVGVIIVVGGPQYRVGSHRQFVLLARTLAKAGFPVMRFDFRGMGDSSGAMRAFTEVSEDIAAAVDAFAIACPSVKRIVLWGLCDGATAAAFYMPTDSRIAGAVLLNPWVRSEAGEAQTMLKHYYLRRLVAPDFWRKLLGGGLNPARAAVGCLDMLVRAARPARQGGERAASKLTVGPLEQSLPRCLQAADRPFLVLLSGKDFVAAEFEAAMPRSSVWAALLEAGRVRSLRFPEANHTFSSQAWRGEVEAATLDWLSQTFVRSPDAIPA